MGWSQDRVFLLVTLSASLFGLAGGYPGAGHHFVLRPSPCVAMAPAAVPPQNLLQPGHVPHSMPFAYRSEWWL